MKREANFNSFFNKWCKNVFKRTAAFELKQTKTNSLHFHMVKQHQLNALSQVKHGSFVWKIPDVGYQNPFDCFSLSGVEAYIVIKYPSFFCLIDIDKFIQEESVSERKSLTANRARIIATIVIPTTA